MEVEGTQRPRRRTPGVAANPATGFHSKGCPRAAHARPVGHTAPPAPSLPAWEGKSVRSRRDLSVQVFPTAAGLLLKRNGNS